MEHLLAYLNQVGGRVSALKAKMKSGTLHPLVASPMLRTVNDGRGFSHVREKSYLEEKGNNVARQLRMFGSYLKHSH